METVLNIPTLITLIPSCFHQTFEPLPSHANGQKIDKGGQCKGDKRVKKGKKGLTFSFFCISLLLELKARYPFLITESADHISTVM